MTMKDYPKQGDIVDMSPTGDVFHVNSGEFTQFQPWTRQRVRVICVQGDDVHVTDELIRGLDPHGRQEWVISVYDITENGKYVYRQKPSEKTPEHHKIESLITAAWRLGNSGWSEKGFNDWLSSNETQSKILDSI